MGYNPNRQHVQRHKTILDLMVNQTQDFKLPSSDPKSLAYEIRRALKGVERFPKWFPEYQPILNKYTLSEKEDYVFFKRRTELVTGEPIIVTPEKLGAGRSLRIEALDTALKIVGAAIQHKAESFTFPDAILGTEELNKIYKWASKNEYHISIMPDGLVLSRSKPTDEWVPQST